MPENPARWRPPTLLCTDLEVRRLVRDYLQFAERFPKTADMQAYRAAGIDNFYTDTTMDILSQLTGGAKPVEAAAEDLLRQAQIVLALALFREEQFLGMHEQEARFEQARDGFAQVLGLDDEEPFAELGVPDEALFPRASVDLPWKGLPSRMLAFLAGGSRVVCLRSRRGPGIRSLRGRFTPCDLDADGLERVCGECVKLSHPVRILANL